MLIAQGIIPRPVPIVAPASGRPTPLPAPSPSSATEPAEESKNVEQLEVRGSVSISGLLQCSLPMFSDTLGQIAYGGGSRQENGSHGTNWRSQARAECFA